MRRCNGLPAHSPILRSHTDSVRYQRNTMTHKTILITGSTDGIGRLAATRLAQDGHRVYLHGRNADKLQTVMSEIRTQTGNTHIGGFLADFSDMAAVQHMAVKAAEKLPALDVLINNAGIYKSVVAQTRDGLDVRFAVNYFAPYLLTHALLPSLRRGLTEAQQARIINLSSAAQAPVDLPALAGKATLPANAAYAQSKLALTMWSMALAAQEQAAGMGVIAVNPGSLLNTNMVREAFGQYWSSADKGANILYELAVSDAYAGVTGRYFDNDRGQGEQMGDFGSAHADAQDAGRVQLLLEKTQAVLATL